MDEEYLMALLQMMMQQDSGLQGPYTGLYGEGHPTSPTGQYRTHKTPYISDGNVPLNKILPDPNKFSYDAFLDLDPRLKQITANAVRSGNHDPYSVYASLDDPEYQYALLQKAIGELGIEYDEPEIGTDQYGRKQYPNIEDLLDDLANSGRTQEVEYESPDIMSGSYKGMKKRTKEVKEADLLRERIAGYQEALDDFTTQAAPSMERNANNVDYAWTRAGGMPYPGINSGALDYEGTGPAFPTATQSLGGGSRQAARPQGSWQSRLRKTAKPKGQK